MLCHVPTPPPLANKGGSFSTPSRRSHRIGHSGTSIASTSCGIVSTPATCSCGTTSWIHPQGKCSPNPTNHIVLSLRGCIALHRASLKRSSGVDGTAPPPHPLHQLRCLGRLITSEYTVGPFVSVLKELNLLDTHVVRLLDVEGRMLSAHDKTLGAVRIASSVKASNEGVQNGGCFSIKILGDNFGYSKVSNNDPFALWRRFTTAVMLYIALADAGFCDQSLPFQSIQWMNWNKLLRDQQHLRLDLMCNRNIRLASALQGECVKNTYEEKNHTIHHNRSGNETSIPVAVILPVKMKGTLHRPFSSSSSSPPSISTEPFSDVEVFQLFYIQLVFRAVYDIRFSGMMINGGFLRSDLIATQSSGTQPLAFQCPKNPDRWLFFPPHSKVLCFVSLEMAVIPHYDSSSRVKETEEQQLFGASPSLPCQGELGRAVVLDWAMKKTIHSPQEARILLEELFNLFKPVYGVERLTVWRSAVAPRLYRCDKGAFMRLRKDNADLAKFMTAAPLSPNSCLKLLLSMPPILRLSSPPPAPSVLGSAIIPDEESVVKLWRKYIQDGDTAHFVRSTDDFEIKEFIARGGSGVVYKGTYGSDRHLVAVKCLSIPDGMPHELYIKESLTNVAFAVLFNQLERFGIDKGASIYDCVISSTPPRGMPEDDVRMCCRGADPTTTSLCYIVNKLMDGSLGRFLREDEDDYDPCYETLINSPLSDGEFFQFLYTQLVLRALFDYTIFDLILCGQLRGDNIGYQYIQTNNNRMCRGLIAVFQGSIGESVQYLCFPVNQNNSSTLNSMRSICFIDLGQGMQPCVQELTHRGLIGESIVDSCIQDDGFGRYWPRESVYAKYIETSGAVAKTAAQWGAGLCLNSPAVAESALRELFSLYAPMYGIDAPTPNELEEYIVIAWTPENVTALQQAYVYLKPD